MENKKFKISDVSPIKLINVTDTSKVNNEGEGSKSSKLSSVLDTCIRSNFSDESFDFIECNFGKNLNVGCKKKENFICEICKTDITDLSVDNRAFHVNKCIDHQISSQCEVPPPPFQDENVVMLGCPFCIKHFSVPELQCNHIKKCGKTRGLSTQNIIQALELERRFQLERIALGLPPKPHKPAKPQKSAAAVKKILVEPKSKTESDIQLAKALSLSLTRAGDAVKLKPPASHQRPGRKNRTGVSSTPLLVLRNDEDRRKLLLEKVANIVENENLCSRNPAEASHSLEHSEDRDKVSEVWNLSSQSGEKCKYYVEELLSWIKPSEMEAGAKLGHLSQIAGHEILTQLPCNYTFSCPGDRDGQGTSGLQCGEWSGSSSGMTECLRSLVASSWMSDADIRTSCGTVIPTHRLILALRCPPLKRDPNFCFGAERSVLRWESVSFEGALQFLNFVYTEKVEVKREILCDLLFLAKKYEVADLLTVLQSFQPQDPPFCEGNTTDEQQTSSTLWCGQEETPVAAFDSDAEDCGDLEIVCEFLNTDLEPSLLPNSQQPSTSHNTCRESILFPRKDFNVSVTESSKEPSLSTKDTDLCSPGENAVEVIENLEDVIGYPVALANMQNTEDYALNEVLEPNQVVYNSHRNPENECKETNVEKANFFKLSDPNSGNLNEIKESKLKEDDILHTKNEDSFKLLSPFSISLGSSNQILETTFKEIEDVHNRHKVVFDSCSDSNGLSSGYLHRDSNAEFENFNVHYTENIDCDSVLFPLSRNLHLGPKTHCTSAARSSELGVKSAAEICELPDNLPLGATSCARDHSELTADSTLRFPEASSGKFASVKDVPSSPVIFDVSGSTSDSDKCEHVDLVGYSNSSNGIIGERDRDRVLKINCVYLNDLSQKLEAVRDESNSLSLESPGKEIFSKPLPNDSECINVRILSDSENFDYISCGNNIRNNDLGDHNDNLSGNRSKNNCPKDSNDISCVKNHLKCQSSIQSLDDSDSDQTSDKMTVVKCRSRRVGVVSGDNNTKFQFSDSPVTPLPDYKKMMTPEIKQALRSIGVKALPRKKAIALLSHVYDETHPLINPEANLPSSSSQRSPQKRSPRKELKKRKLLSENVEQLPTKKQKENNTSSQESEDSSSENPDWSGCVPEISFSQFNGDSPTKVNKDDLEAVKQYIRSNENVYSHVLNYKPLNMLDFHHDLKDTGIRISVQKLMDFLDEQCITFTCPRKEDFRKKQTARTQRFRKNMMARLSQQH